MLLITQKMNTLSLAYLGSANSTDFNIFLLVLVIGFCISNLFFPTLLLMAGPGRPQSPETKAKISEAMKGRKVSEETKEKMREMSQKALL